MSNIPKTITLYHGSLRKNKEVILQNGIKYYVPNSKRKVDEASKEISEKMNVKGFSKNDMVTSRLDEAKQKGGVVFLSANKNYAIANALAGQEWKEYLVINALRKKFPEEFRISQKLRHKELKCLRRLEELGKKEIKALTEEQNLKKANYYRDKRKSVQIKYLKAQEEYRVFDYTFGSKLREERNKILTDKAVLFKVELPWEKFKELADEQTKDGIGRFEDGFKVPVSAKDFFQEVRLKEVPKEYIKSVGNFVQPRFYAFSKYSLKVPMKKIDRSVDYV